MQKQISKLVKEKEKQELENPKTILQQNQNDSIINMFYDKCMLYFDKGNLLSFLTITMFNLMIIFISWRNYLIVSNTFFLKYNKNIILKHFYSEESVKIPLSYILITQSLLVNKLSESIKTLYKQYITK